MAVSNQWTCISKVPRRLELSWTLLCLHPHSFSHQHKSLGKSLSISESSFSQWWKTWILISTIPSRSNFFLRQKRNTVLFHCSVINEIMTKEKTDRYFLQWKCSGPALRMYFITLWIWIRPGRNTKGAKALPKTNQLPVAIFLTGMAECLLL